MFKVKLHFFFLPRVNLKRYSDLGYWNIYISRYLSDRQGLSPCCLPETPAAISCNCFQNQPEPQQALLKRSTAGTYWLCCSDCGKNKICCNVHFITFFCLHFARRWTVTAGFYWISPRKTKGNFRSVCIFKVRLLVAATSWTCLNIYRDSSHEPSFPLHSLSASPCFPRDSRPTLGSLTR